MKLLLTIALGLAACKPGVPLACRDYDELANKAVACGRMTQAAADAVHVEMAAKRGPADEQTCRAIYTGLHASLEGCAGIEVFESP